MIARPSQIPETPLRLLRLCKAGYSPEEIRAKLGLKMKAYHVHRSIVKKLFNAPSFETALAMFIAIDG